MTSLIQTSRHKMATLRVVFLRLSNVDFLKDEKLSEKLLCFHRFNKIATKSEKWEAQTGMCQWSTSTFQNSCGCTALDMLEWREMTEQTDWRAKQPSQEACFLEDLKRWKAWDSTCGHKAKDITPSVSWRRETLKEEALDDLPWKDERGPSSVRRTLEPFQRQRWGHVWETGWSSYGLFRAYRYHLELYWTELLCIFVSSFHSCR